MVKLLKQHGFSFGLERFFTRETTDAFDLIHFHQAETFGEDSEDNAFESPDNWSAEATTAFAEDAAFRTAPESTKNVEENTVPSWLWRRAADSPATAKENSVRHVIRRVAGSATYIGWKKDIFADENEARVFFDEARYLLTQRFIVLEPRALAARGLGWAYGIEKKTDRSLTSESSLNFETSDFAKKSRLAVVDIRNSSIDALLGSDKAIGQKWQKFLSAGAKTGLLGLRFTDIAGDWNGGPGAFEHSAIDLLAFRREDGSIDIDRLRHGVKLLVMLLALNEAPVSETIAIGFHNLAPLLMGQALAYDSDAGRATAAAIAGIVTAEAYATSAMLAAMLGPSLDYAANGENVLRALRNHRRTAYGDHTDYEKISVLPSPLTLNDGADLTLIAEARRRWDEALELARQHGLVFTRVTDLATPPALAYFMESTTRGIAPMSDLTLMRSSEADIYHREIHPAVTEALIKLGYDANARKSIIEHIVGAHSLADAPGVNHRLLKRHGFDETALARVEHYLPCVNDIHLAFTSWILGENFFRDTLKIPEKKLNDPRFDLLRHLGFTPADIAAANAYCYGHGSAISAAGIRTGHITIFAQAREISTEARVQMAAAVQGLLSGETGLQISLASGSTLDECEKLLLDAWKRGVKSIVLEFTPEDLAAERPVAAIVEKASAKSSKPMAAPQYRAPLRSALRSRSKASGEIVSHSAKSGGRKRPGSRPGRGN